MNSKSMIKRTRYRNRKILANARGKDCTMQLPGVCNRDPETTVAAHSGLIEDGKGMSMKGDDFAVCYACSSCHDVYDNRAKHDFDRDFLTARFHRAMKETLRICFEDDVIG
jgi:hypothetical protein